MDDSFQMSFTHVRRSPRGCGKNRKMKPGHSGTFKRMKQTVVTIQKENSLCCARAIATAKVMVNGNPSWKGFQVGGRILCQVARHFAPKLTFHSVHMATRNCPDLHWLPVCTITNFTSRCHSRLSRDVVSTCAGKTTGPIVRQKSLRCHHVFCLVSLELAIFFVVLQIVQ